MFAHIVITNIHTETVELDEKRTGNKLRFAFSNSPWSVK